MGRASRAKDKRRKPRRECYICRRSFRVPYRGGAPLAYGPPLCSRACRTAYAVAQRLEGRAIWPRPWSSEFTYEINGSLPDNGLRFSTVTSEDEWVFDDGAKP